MATTHTSSTRPLSEYAPGESVVQTFHTWEHERRGVVVERTYRLDHASASCPLALGAEGIGARTAETDADDEGWPCSECWVDDAATPDRRPNGDERDSIDAPESSGSGGASKGEAPATDKQVRFVTALVRTSTLADGSSADLTTDQVESVVAEVVAELAPSKRRTSARIDALLGAGHKPTWEPVERRSADEAEAVHAEQEQASERPERTNRYAARCAACGVEVAAEQGSLTKGASGWEVRHFPTCPERSAEQQRSDGYEPTKGDVHVLDGDYYRVHLSQTGGYFYGAVWDGSGFVGPRFDQRAKGSLRRMSTATLATAEQAAAFGHMNERCCFCSHAIDTPESTKVGYGPDCAAKRGLPWGE